MLCVELRMSAEVDQYVTKRRIGLYSASLPLAFQFGDSLRTFVETGDESKIAGG